MGSLYLTAHRGRAIKPSFIESEEFSQWLDTPDGESFVDRCDAAFYNFEFGEPVMLRTRESETFYYSFSFKRLDAFYSGEMFDIPDLTPTQDLIDKEANLFNSMLLSPETPEILRDPECWSEPHLIFKVTS